VKGENLREEIKGAEEESGEEWNELITEEVPA
jgi:hypothetical protein